MADADYDISGPYSSIVTPKSANDSYLYEVAKYGKRFGRNSLPAACAECKVRARRVNVN